VKIILSECRWCGGRESCGYPPEADNYTELCLWMMRHTACAYASWEPRLTDAADWWVYDQLRSEGRITLDYMKECIDDNECPFAEPLIGAGSPYVPNDATYRVGARLWLWLVVGMENGPSVKRALTMAAKRPPLRPEVMAREMLERAGVEIIG